jgi:hypothetical protein
MRLGLTVFAVVLALGVGTAEAAKKFPKAIDSPIVRPKVKEYHKPGTKMKHLQEGSKITSTVAVADTATA